MPAARAAAALLLVALGALPAAAQAPAATVSPPAPDPAAPLVELTEATIVERDMAVEVWVRLSREARYQIELMDSPYRLVLDFDDTAYRWVRYAVPVVADPVRQLRGSQYRKGVARLVIELQRKATYTIDADREGLRIVIPRVEASTEPRPATTARPTPPPAARPTATPLVYGIIRLDERSHAYIFDPETRQVRRYAEGDTLGNAVVETIGERHVVLRTPSGRLELRVETKPDATPRPSEPLTPRGGRPAPPPVGPLPTTPRS
jgi:AMIN domain